MAAHPPLRGWRQRAGYAGQPAARQPIRAVGVLRQVIPHAAGDEPLPLSHASASGRRRGASERRSAMPGAPGRADEHATRRGPTRRRAELTGADRDAERRGRQSEARSAVADRCVRYNKWPLTRRTDGRTSETERRIRRAARNATTQPCGRRAAASYTAMHLSLTCFCCCI